MLREFTVGRTGLLIQPAIDNRIIIMMIIIAYPLQYRIQVMLAPRFVPHPILFYLLLLLLRLRDSATRAISFLAICTLLSGGKCRTFLFLSMMKTSFLSEPTSESFLPRSFATTMSAPHSWSF